MVCRRGWCTVHDEWLVHSSGGNSSDRFSDQINWFNRKGNLKNIVNCEIISMLKGGGILMWSLSATETWLLMSGSEVSGTHTGMCFFFLQECFFIQEFFSPTAMFFSYSNVFSSYRNVFPIWMFFFLQESFSYIFLFLISLIVFCKDVVENALNLFKNNSDNNTTTSTNYLV